MGFSIEEFWDTNPILYYLLIEQYNDMHSKNSNTNSNKKIYYKEDL